MSAPASDAGDKVQPSKRREGDIDLSVVGVTPVRSALVSKYLAPELKAEELLDIISEAETIKRKIRLEYGDRIEEMMAERGHWNYSSKTEESRNGLSTDSTKGTYNEEDGIYTTARQKRLRELLSDSTPIRASLMKAQEHALASLIDATKTGIEWELRSAYLRNEVREDGSSSQEERNTVDPVTTANDRNICGSVVSNGNVDVAAVKEGLVKRLDLLLMMQAEHLQQQRCVTTTEDKKNLIMKGERATYNQLTNTDEGTMSPVASVVVDSPPKLVMGASDMAVEGVADL